MTSRQVRLCALLSRYDDLRVRATSCEDEIEYWLLIEEWQGVMDELLGMVVA